ncbi:MAG: plastocyanin/azurin family copper-binding protein [Gemmatimonadaceae bacterium]
MNASSGRHDVSPTTMLLVSGMLAATLLAGCGGDSSTGPRAGGGATGGSNGGGTGNTGSPAPATAAVTVGDIFFKSARNGSSNSAVDTVAVGGTVTWTWAANASLPHSVQSLGSPSFTSSAIQTGSGSTHKVTFAAPGTYQYDCAVHGRSMTGTIVVQTAASAAASAAAAPAPSSQMPAYP